MKVAMLKTLAAATIAVVFVGFANSAASAGDDDVCHKVGDRYFLNGDQVDKCAKAQGFKVTSQKHSGNVDVCNEPSMKGKYTHVKMKGRTALVRCRD